VPETIPFVDFREAREYFQSLVPMTDEEWAVVEEEIRDRAFTVAQVTTMDALLEIYNGIDKRFTEGIPFKDFQAEMMSVFEDRGWIGPSPWQLENIFDNNIQTAYGVGRLIQHTDMIDLYPYGEYVDVGDDKVRPHHHILNNQIHLMDSDFWRAHYPPWEFR
jgi:hypothetical protein